MIPLSITHFANLRYLPDWVDRHVQSFLACHTLKDERGAEMLWTLFAIVMVLWLLGVVSFYTLDGFIHLALVLGVGVVLIRIIEGRRPVA